MQDILQRILTMSTAIRYVAIYYGGALVSTARPDLANASSPESDKYEELLGSVGLEATSDPLSLVPGILAAAAPLQSAHRAV